jgi:hypothetical protein
MTRMSAAGDRLRDAGDLPAVLDAAFEAFEAMLAAIGPCQDPASVWFTGFVMAAASAADGRDVLIFASSLPQRPLRPRPAGEPDPEARAAEVVAAAVVTLSQLVAGRLALAASWAGDDSDRVACQQAARCAGDICGFVRGAG